MKVTQRSLRVLAAAFAVMALVAAPLTARAQSQTTKTVSIPSSDQVIEMRAMLPDEVRVGETFEYKIEINNVSDDFAVHDLVIHQLENDGIRVESARIESKPSNTRRNSGQDDDSQADAQGQTDGRTWTVVKMQPGDSQTVFVTATAEKEGKLATCLAVKSYTPALCLAVEAVKPELEIVKKTPEKAELCGTLEWAYYVKNTGSGDPGQFTIRDELPKGLQTTTGDKHLEFKVDGISPGDVRKFVAQLRAQEAGDYSSFAVAVRDNGKKAKSNKAGTNVVEADLAVAIEGPRVRYVNRLADYTVRVTNHGEADARGATLKVHYPGEFQMVRVGQPQSSEEAVAESSGSQKEHAHSKQSAQDKSKARDRKKSKDQQQARDQRKQVANKQSQKNRDNRDQDTARMDPSEQQSWDLGTLKAGETIEVQFTARSDNAGEAKFEAQAQFICEALKDEYSIASATTVTELIALPALMIAVIDNEDPIPVNKNVQYTIVVGNEGEAADQDIQIQVELPEQLEFVEASGETKAQADGQNLKFDPVKTLEPGEKVRWFVTTKATKAGDVRLQVKLTSQHLDRSTSTEEPTVLFDGSVSGG